MKDCSQIDPTSFIIFLVYNIFLDDYNIFREILFKGED